MQEQEKPRTDHDLLIELNIRHKLMGEYQLNTNQKIDQIISTLSTKADKSDLAPIIARISLVEGKVTDLEQVNRDRKMEKKGAVTVWRIVKEIWPYIVALSGIAVAVREYFIK